MANCTTCKKDVVPSITLDAQRGAVHVCPGCGNPIDVAPPQDVSIRVSELRGPEHVHVPVLVDGRHRAPAALLANLPAAVRARKKELRETIKRSQRELAQLDRLTQPAKRPATVTAIKRSAS